MGLTNWQLFFQNLQTAVTDQPIGDNEVLTVVREVNETTSIDDDAVESAYALTILADNPGSFWRFNDIEGFSQAVRSDGATGCWRLHGDVSDFSGNGRTGIAWGGVVFGAFGTTGPINNLVSAPTFG